MNGTQLILAVITASLVVVTLRQTISSLHLALTAFLPACYGMYELYQRGTVASSVLTLYLTGIAALFSGLAISRAVLGTGNRLGPDPSARAISRPIAPVGALTLLGTGYHFMAGGVPLLSSNPEISRFDFTSSGFLGIPGRLYLFGLPIALLMAYAEARQKHIPLRRHRWFVLIAAAYALSRVLSGFKSGILEVVTTAIIIGICSGRGLDVRRATRRLTAGLVIGGGLALAVGHTYATYQAQSSVSEAIYRRATTQAATPAAIVLARTPGITPTGQSPLAIDVHYFLAKYFHLGAPIPHSYSELVAASMAGLPPDTTAYLAPVTTGIAPYLYAGWGMPAYLLAVAIGAFVGSMEVRARQSTMQPHRWPFYGMVVLACQDIITKGNPVYVVLNWGLVFLGLVVLQRTARALSIPTTHTYWPSGIAD